MGMMVGQTEAQITGSDLTTSAVNHVTGLKVKADGDPIGTIKAWPSSQTPNTEEWLECDGSSFNKDEYPELFAALGSTTLPDYKGQFLRGGNAADAGKKFEDTIKAHEVVVPSHTHSFNGSISGTALTGTAAGQKFSTNANLSVNGTNAGGVKVKASDLYYVDPRETYSSTPAFCFDTSGGRHTYTHECGHGISITAIGRNPNVIDYTSGRMGTYDYGQIVIVDTSAAGNGISGNATGVISGTAKSSSVTMNMPSSTISGSGIGESGELLGLYEGSGETTPKHIYVRYFIKAQ